MTPTPTEVVDAINAVSGEHPGSRAAHAKGTLMSAAFTATPEAASLSRAAHLNGDTFRATVRFSNGGGDPGIPDYAREARGVAIKLYVDDETRMDMVGLSLPCFFVRTVEDFYEFTRARAEGMEAAGAFVQQHPESVPAIQAALGAGPPASYATCAFNGIHTFRWTNAEGQTRHVRCRLEPEAGVQELSDEDAKARGRDYLQEDIRERAGAAFRLVVSIAEEGDPLDDPTAQWPEGRRRVEIGRVVLDGLDTQRETGDDVLVFDPARVTDGIELTDDEIVRTRSEVYALSVLRRTGVARAGAHAPT